MQFQRTKLEQLLRKYRKIIYFKRRGKFKNYQNHPVTEWGASKHSLVGGGKYVLLDRKTQYSKEDNEQ